MPESADLFSLKSERLPKRIHVVLLNLVLIHLFLLLFHLTPPINSYESSNLFIHSLRKFYE